MYIAPPPLERTGRGVRAARSSPPMHGVADASLRDTHGSQTHRTEYLGEGSRGLRTDGGAEKAVPLYSKSKIRAKQRGEVVCVTRCTYNGVRKRRTGMLPFHAQGRVPDAL
eukprot:4637539-Prymnesium_polylepis.2